MPLIAAPLAIKGFALGAKALKGSKVIKGMKFLKKGSKARELLAKGFTWAKEQTAKIQQVQRNPDGSYTASGEGFQVKTPSYAAGKSAAGSPQTEGLPKWVIPAAVIGALLIFKK
jgi:hypothetical protein